MGFFRKFLDLLRRPGTKPVDKWPAFFDRGPFARRRPNHRLGLPWLMPLYRPLNGPHPLVASFVEDNQAIDPVFLSPSVSSDNAVMRELLKRLSQQTRLISPEWAGPLIDWLSFPDQLAIESQAECFDTLFLHTTPLYLGDLPWIFHFESFPTLFMPYIFHGETRGVDLKAEGFFALVRQTLESRQCLKIFSHMRKSLHILDRVFDSPIIASKLHHVPVGIVTPPASESLAKFDHGGELRILFTNSLHQDPSSFYVRGGHHLLEAFSQLRRHLPDMQLTVLSTVPADLKRRFSSRDLARVNWINQRVDDATLRDLLLSHHLFALPAAGLHSYSFLRAISHGCVPIVSDAPGYDEWTPGIEESILMIRGIRDLIYRDEPAGWVSDLYAPFVSRSEYFVQQIYDAVLANTKMPGLRKLAAQNIEHCRLHFSPEAAQAEFNRMLAQSGVFS